MSAITLAAFDYATLDPNLATDARAVAARIRQRLTLNYVETGRDLAEMKTKLGHGQFCGWLAAEFSMSERTAENYVSAAKFLEGKSASVAVLPPAVVYALAAPSTPSSVVDDIVAAAEAGALPAASEIRNRIADAKEAARKQAVADKKSPEALKRERENEKRRRAAEQERGRRRDAEWAANEAARDAKAHDVATLLFDRLGAGGVVDLLTKLRNTDWYRVERVLANGPLPRVHHDGGRA